MLKNRLTLTIFGRFLEGNLNFDHIWTAQFHFDHIWTAQYQFKFPSKNRPNMVKVSLFLSIFSASLFFPCWWASGQDPSLTHQLDRGSHHHRHCPRPSSFGQALCPSPRPSTWDRTQSRLGILTRGWSSSCRHEVIPNKEVVGNHV